jgi:hypothetical protein
MAQTHLGNLQGLQAHAETMHELNGSLLNRHSDRGENKPGKHAQFASPIVGIPPAVGARRHKEETPAACATGVSD